MKILAIRGENLASLPGFGLELDSGPLEPTRIFAITGPTGAGKSTLLDALCLALYDRVPRLVGGRGTPTSDEGLPAGDPRGVMRRGTGQAWAEVDFIGVEGGRYRARWEVWRARRRPEGRVQDQRVRLLDLAGPAPVELTEGKKTDTLAAIQARVGLGFTEFRRAVLLAQGDFDAFLAARPDERAALLERMTGTEIYADLSRQAFLRGKAHAEALEAARARLGSIEILEAAARSDLEIRRRASAERVTEATRDLDLASAALEWHHVRRRLEEERDKAAIGFERARESAVEATSLEARIVLIRAVARLRPLSASARTAADDDEGAAEALRAAEARAGAAAATLEVSDRELTAARSARDRAEAALTAARSPLRAARALDEELSHRALELESARSSEARARAALEAVEERRRRARGQLDKARARAAAAAAWRARHRHVEALAPTGARVVRQLEQLAERDQRAKTARARRRALEEEGRSRGEALAEAQLRRDATEVEFAAARRACDAAEEAHASAVERTDRPGLDAARALFFELHAALMRLRQAATDKKRRAGELGHLRRRQREAEAALARGEAEVEARRARAGKAREALLTAELTADWRGRRSELLVEDAPCPLCGSRAHPYRSSPPPAPPPATTRACDAARARLAEADAEVERATAAVAEARAQAAEAAARLEAIAAADRQDETTRAQLARRLTEIWMVSPLLHHAGMTKVGLLLPPSTPARREQLGPALEQLDRVETSLDEMTNETEASAQALRAAQTRLTAARSARSEAETALDGAQTRADDAARSLEDLDQDLAELQAERAELIAELTESLAGWPSSRRVQTEPAELAAEVQARLQTFADHSTELAGLTAELEGLEARDPELSAERASADRIRAELEGRARALEAELELRREARGRLLEGRPADEVEHELEAAATAARRAFDLAAAARAEADTARGAAHGELEQRRQRRDEAKASRDRAARSLAEALAELPEGDRDDVERALNQPPEDPEALERRRQRLLLDRARAEATLADRSERWARHLEAPASLELEQAERAKADAAARLEAGRDEQARVTARLDVDDRARARREALRPELDGLSATAETWAELSALIGSADGKKLRTFAQSLTLDALIEQSNLHLRSLRPRYRLRRVRAADMELEVVDLDMGEEVRPIGSLSGGETFLASLALALGLSDLSARSVRVESLFVDEGFGALDAESLEIALSALDQLQASGRTVGVVSHVPEVAERLGFEVRVRPVGPGRSTIEIRAP